MLGGAIVAAHAESALAAHRGDLHDIAAVLFDHMGQYIAAAQVGALELGVDDIVPGLLVHFRNGDHGRVAGVVDQYVDLTEGLHDLVHHALHGGRLAHIAFDADGLDAHGFKALHGIVHGRFGGQVIRKGTLIFADIGNGDIRTFFGQAAGDG